MFAKWLMIFLIACGSQMIGDVHAKEGKKILCYYATWATYSSGLGKFDVDTIDPYLCTHLIYPYFGVDDTGDLRSFNQYLDNAPGYNIKKFNQLKLKNPTLKTLASIGGWNAGSKNFSIVANDARLRQRFVEKVVEFVQFHNFDGIDLDWEFPGQRHSLKNDDHKNYVTLLKELREGFSPFNLLLTVFVAGSEYSASISYDIREMSKYVDFINVKAYDFHGDWNKKVGIHGALYRGPWEDDNDSRNFNGDAAMRYWIGQGAPRHKLIITVAFYGRTFTLSDAKRTQPGSPHDGRGFAGQYAKSTGMIGYNELCEKMEEETWTERWEPDQKAPYAFKDRHWVGYESPRSIRLKAEYVLDHDYAGIMVWSVDNDDFLGNCGGPKNPLLHTINDVFYGVSATGMSSETKDNGTCPKRSCSVFHIADNGRQPVQFECKQSELPKSPKKVFPRGVNTSVRNICTQDRNGGGVSHCTFYMQFSDGTAGKELNAVVEFKFNSEFFERTSLHLY